MGDHRRDGRRAARAPRVRGAALIAEHSLFAVGVCPADGSRDVYEVKVTTGALIEVGEILAAVERLTAAPVFQEDLTDRLADALGARVWIRGRHLGVDTVTEAGKADE